MSTNNFLPFATAGGAAVLSQAAYAAITPANGYGPGILPKEKFNKAVRQAGTMAAAVGQVIADAGYDALDDGDVPTLIANLKLAIASYASGAGFTGSLTGNGYLTFPAPLNLTVQWGTTASFTTDSPGNVVVFPVDFATACFIVTATPSTDNGAVVGTQYSVGIFGKTTHQFQLNNDSQTSTFDWIAIGY